jgi:hypothetical protein
MRSDSAEFSRREWLRNVSIPALGASVIAGLPAAIPPSSGSRGARLYDVRDHGAKGDGTTLDTAAVQRAIGTCHAEGGGTVRFCGDTRTSVSICRWFTIASAGRDPIVATFSFPR